MQWVGKHAVGIMLLLMFVALAALLVAVQGWRTATSTREQLQAEKLGKVIADVTSCFNAADRRPQLELILRGIAAEIEPDPRQALTTYIDDYTRNTPDRQDCVALAEKNGIDPKPYLKNPPSEAGKQQEGR
jgi:hypothetical protein